jgi:hypothetical protein
VARPPFGCEAVKTVHDNAIGKTKTRPGKEAWNPGLARSHKQGRAVFDFHPIPFPTTTILSGNGWKTHKNPILINFRPDGKSRVEDHTFHVWMAIAQVLDRWAIKSYYFLA